IFLQVVCHILARHGGADEFRAVPRPDNDLLPPDPPGAVVVDVLPPPDPLSSRQGSHHPRRQTEGGQPAVSLGEGQVARLDPKRQLLPVDREPQVSTNLFDLAAKIALALILADRPVALLIYLLYAGPEGRNL